MTTNSFLRSRVLKGAAAVPFAMTTAGFIIPLVTGTLSACSSGLIIYIILRSQQKLSTTYHRIMAFMSAFDIISSIFIALGTIMMPSDNIFPFAGPTLGNQVTCQIQGWLILFGYLGTAAMNACLAWYFVCSLAFKVGFVKIRNRIEPLMYIYVAFFSLFAPTLLLSKDLLNSTPYDNFCTLGPHVVSCQALDGAEYKEWMSVCDMGKGDKSAYNKYFSSVVFTLMIQFILIVLGMSIILWTVYSNHRELQKTEQNSNDILDQQNDPEQHCNNKSQALSRTKFTRVLISQALMYISAFMLTWFLNFLSGIFNVATFGLDAINSVIFPLQGLWNLITFLYDKSYLIRRRDTNTTFWQAARQIITSSSDIQVVYLSNISAVTIDNREEEWKEEKTPPNSKIASEYDEISKLRGDLSILPSSDDSSKLVSTTSIVSQEKAPSANLVNVRRSWKQTRRAGQGKEELLKKEEPLPSISDVENSKMASEYDELSNMRGDLSVLPSSDDSSMPVSTTSTVSQEKAPRTNLVNVRRNWKQIRRAGQENI